MKHNEKKDLENANKKVQQLDDVILTLKEEIRSLNQQVKKCGDEVKDIYKKYRDEVRWLNWKHDASAKLICSHLGLKQLIVDSRVIFCFSLL